MKMLDKLFRRTPADLLAAESGFSRDDRKAIVREFAEGDTIEPGLGEAIARYVIRGKGESVLLRIDAVLAKGGDVAERLKICLSVPQYAPAALKMTIEDLGKRLTSRERILIDLEGFDAAGMRRLGLIQAKAAYWLYSHGTERCPAWLRALSRASDSTRLPRPGHDRRPPFLTAPYIRDMLAVEGLSVGPLVDLLFGSPRYGQGPDGGMKGIVPVLEVDPDAVCDEMVKLPANNRGIFINYLADTGLLDRVPAFFERIFLAAGASAQATREPALGALSKMDRARVEARALAGLTSVNVEERLAGVHALAETLGSASLAPLELHLAGEKARKVVQAIEALRPKLALAGAVGQAMQDDGPYGYTALDASRVMPPPMHEAADNIPADAAEVFRTLMEAANESSRAEFDHPPSNEKWFLQNRGAYAKPFDTRSISHLIDVLKGSARSVDAMAIRRAVMQPGHYYPKTSEAFSQGLRALFDRVDFGIRPLARVYVVLFNEPWSYHLLSMFQGQQTGMPIADALARRIRAGADARDIIAVLESGGFPASDHIGTLLGMLWWRLARDDERIDNETVWPVFAGCFDAIDAAIARSSALKRSDGQEIVLSLCNIFPKPPQRYLRHLLDAAAQGPRIHRRLARRHLESLGNLTPVIEPLLKERVAATRAGAAAWLRERKDTDAIPVLRAALKVEKDLAAKAAILAALAACGEDVSEQFSEEKLMAEAARELPKLKVDYSAFMDRSTLPALRWADGRAVDPLLVDYWFARAHKLKQPGADPMLELVLGRLDPDDSAAMGRRILSTFVQLDTRKATSDEANTYAEANADTWVKIYRRGDASYTREQAFARLRQAKLAEYRGSALDHRGLLALARYTAPGEAVAIVQRYLKDHGKRPNQCRALMEMLAADPIPQKLQLILAAAKRHKQPGARKFAATLADAIADERGWSAAELADRTVPTLDLDAAGTLPLPVGERAFRLRLTDEFTLAIETPEGKVVNALPALKDPQEAAAVKAAKATVTAARKELKQTLELQTARLYEAMCVARRWDAADFAVAFLGHPILSRLLRRLVISGHDASGALLGSARLLDDGTLSDVEDNSVAPASWAGISLAHRATLGEAASEAWRAHLADYAVVPLFSQFDQPLQPLAAGTASAITDRQGFAIDSFALRNAAARRHYQAGAIMEASFAAYERIFPDLGLAACIGFSGGIVGDKTTHVAALHGLRFVRVRGGNPSEWGAEGIELDKVPPILLQEAWADYHAIGTAGTGFDPNWEKLGLW